MAPLNITIKPPFFTIPLQRILFRKELKRIITRNLTKISIIVFEYKLKMILNRIYPDSIIEFMFWMIISLNDGLLQTSVLFDGFMYFS